MGSEHDGSVESVEQSGRMMSEPTQSCDSIRHHDDALELELGFELEFEYGAEPVELELLFEESPGAEELEFEYGAEPVELELLFEDSPGAEELGPDFRHARLKPSENLPGILSTGIILPYALMVSAAHLFCTSDHHFWLDCTQSSVQRSLTFSGVQR